MSRHDGEPRLGGPLVDGVEQRRHELPLPGTSDSCAVHGGATRRPNRPTRRQRLSRPRPTSLLPDSTYEPTHEPTEVRRPRAHRYIDLRPDRGRDGARGVASFNCSAFDGALLRIEDRDLTLRMEDGSFHGVELPGRR